MNSVDNVIEDVLQKIHEPVDEGSVSDAGDNVQHCNSKFAVIGVGNVDQSTTPDGNFVISESLNFFEG